MPVFLTAQWPNHTVPRAKPNKIRDLNCNNPEAHSAIPFSRNNYKPSFGDPRTKHLAQRKASPSV